MIRSHVDLLLARAREEDLSVAERRVLDAHLEVCSDCRALAEDIDRADALLSQPEPSMPVPPFAPRLPRGGSVTARSAALAVGVIALALVAGSALALWRTQHRDVPATTPGPTESSRQGWDDGLRRLCRDWEQRSDPRDPIWPSSFLEEFRAALGSAGGHEITDAAPCVNARFSAPSELPLVLALIPYSNAAGIFWREGDDWRAQNLVLVDYSEIALLRQHLGPYGREVFFSARGSGSGGVGFVSVVRLSDGRWRDILVTPPRSDFTVVLDVDHVVVTAPNFGDAPLACAAHACWPNGYQWLWRRDGDSFALAAERQAPSTFYTLNVFLGALRDPGPHADVLARFGTPEAIEGARRLGLEGVDIEMPTFEERAGIDRAEVAHWSALPPALNGPPPSVVGLEVTLPSPAARITLARAADRWIVESIRGSSSSEAF